MNNKSIEVEAALRLALDALKEIHVGNMTPMAEINWNKAITAIKAVLEAHKALAQQSNEQVEPDWNDEQLKMLNFLYGAGDFDGVWFEQKHPTERGAFWWRKHLKRLFAHPPVPDAKLTAQPKEPAPEEWMTEEEQTAYTFGWFKAMEAQRKPLTDEQIYQMWTDEGLANSYDIYSLKEHVRRAARAIEAAHGIKGDA